MIIKLKNNKYIRLEKTSTREFVLHTNSNDILLKYDSNYYITTIIIEDMYRIKLGDNVTVGDTIYKVNLIKKQNNSFTCIQENVTKTAQFIMPVLNNNYEYYDFGESFYNAYLSEDYHSLYLVYKFINSEKYLEVEELLREHEYFEEILDPSPELVIIKLSIPKLFWKDVNKIMEGKYSTISTAMKAKICLFHRFGSNSKTYRMLYKEDSFRIEMSKKLQCDIPKEIDLVSKPILKDEIWNSTNILKLDGIKSLNPM